MISSETREKLTKVMKLITPEMLEVGFVGVMYQTAFITALYRRNELFEREYRINLELQKPFLVKIYELYARGYCY